MKDQIEIENIGPIEKLTIPALPDGGVMVLQGRNGSGKSTALEATQTLLKGKGALSHRDGQLQGNLEAYGAKITVARSTRRTGELDVINLEGRLSLADFVDPKLKSDSAADNQRIKALLELTGAKAGVDEFKALVGDALFDEACPVNPDSDDIVDLAAKIKREFEAAARREEKQAKDLSAKASAIYDLESEAPQPIDVEAAKEEAIEAHKNISGIEERRRLATKRKGEIEAAQKQLVSLEANYSEDAHKDAITEYKSAVAKEGRVKEKLDTARTQLAELTVEVELLEMKFREAASEQKSKSMHVDRYDMTKENIELMRPIANEAIEAFDEETYETANLEYQAARDREVTAIRRQEALDKFNRATEMTNEAEKHQRTADVYRAGAKGTDDVLSRSVNAEPLRVEGGQLVLDTNRGTTRFGDLSEGERWRIALDLAAKRVGKGGLIVVPQAAWEGLDPTNRQAVADQAKALTVTVLTAQAADGEIKAKEFKSGK